MELGIENKVALITGGAGAIGQSIAEKLSQEGVKIVLLDLSQEAIDLTTQSLKSKGADVIGLCADVTNQNQIIESIEYVNQHWGGVDILVNNAGFSRDSYLTRMPEENWKIVLDVIIQGTYHCSRAVLPGMMEKKFGRIVNITSRAYMGNPGQTNYSTAKAGLLGFTRSLAMESGKFGITVNAVAPGLIATPRLKSREDYPALEARALKNTPVGRIGEPEDVADAVVFLCSKRAGFISGEVIHVSGGRG
ncbi:SDR family NAD(P)-dependent oxidoreductase [Orrella sp. 11846]|uniref:SDR family NAD(P)-dependent oxidoreductase n=1 Tax=Orrella sp. 11846 TaxID=3409913 RepID=UPI003B5BD993